MLAAAGALGWQHLLLLIFFWAALTPRPEARALLRDWWPLIAFWLSYDAMRLAATLLLPRVAVRAPFEWEARLFAAPDGTIWPFYLTRWLARHAADFGVLALRTWLELVYLTQLFGMPVILLVLWFRGSDLLFRRLVWSLTLLHAATLAIYFAYPAAPPWWVYENGFALPTAARSAPEELPQGSTLQALFQMSPNRFAAIPSMHGAYPLLLTCVLALHGAAARWTWLAAFYTANMWLACVFLNQHYWIDLLLGALLVPPALFVAARVRERHRNE